MRAGEEVGVLVGRRCRPSQDGAAAGFTLIEFIVAVCVIAILLGTLLNRVWFYQEQAEKAAMQQVAATIQNALIMEYGSLVAHGQEAQTAELARENPMNWLARKPDNYAGEFYDPTPRSVAPGNWMFDLRSRDLIYVVDRGEYFTPGNDGNKWVRYHVRLLPVSGPSGKQGTAGLLFEPVAPYSWFRRGD
jgi:general secretion pathway protein G